MKQNYSFLVPDAVFQESFRSIAFCPWNISTLTLAKRLCFQFFIECYEHVVCITERYSYWTLTACLHWYQTGVPNNDHPIMLCLNHRVYISHFWAERNGSSESCLTLMSFDVKTISTRNVLSLLALAKLWFVVSFVFSPLLWHPPMWHYVSECWKKGCSEGVISTLLIFCWQKSVTLRDFALCKATLKSEEICCKTPCLRSEPDLTHDKGTFMALTRSFLGHMDDFLVSPDLVKRAV